jgi:hypothetical protein
MTRHPGANGRPVNDLLELAIDGRGGTRRTQRRVGGDQVPAGQRPQRPGQQHRTGDDRGDGHAKLRG